MKTLAALREDDEPFIGGKASGLSRLVRAGFPVPEALVLDTRDLARFTRGVPPPDVAAGISRCAGALRARGYANLAIRSSALGEDSADASFAGMFETVLNVPVGDFGAILAAIRKCVDARNSERAIAYRKARGLPREAGRMAIIVQAMIPGEVSGVLFTVDPVRGLDTTHVIEAVKGTGERLVGGTVTPERYTYDWRAVNSPAPEMRGPLKPDEIRALSRLALDVQRDQGFPLDFEWTIRDGKIFLLQARPITRISFETSEEWTNANMKDGGVASSVVNPFIASLYKKMMNRTMPDYFTRMRMLPKGIQREWATTICGHLYWNLSATKLAVKQLPGFIEREFDEGLGITPNYEGKGDTTPLSAKTFFQGLRILSALKHSFRDRPAASEAIVRHSDRVFSEITPVTIRALSDRELCERASRLIETDWLTVEGGYFSHICDNSNCRTLFLKALDRYNRKAQEKISALDLVTGLGEIPHLAPLEGLWAISRSIRAQSAARDAFMKLSTAELVLTFKNGKTFPFHTEISALISEFRYRSPRELDLRVPCWDEDPTQVFESLQALVATDDSNDPRPTYARQSEIFASARSKITRSKLRKLLDQHRALLKQREALRIHSIRTLYLVRLVFLELGRRLVACGKLALPDDIFFLDYPDALSLSRDEGTEILRARMEKNRAYYESYRNYRKPSEIRKTRPSLEPTPPVDAVPSRIKITPPITGVGCSPGTVEGEICVIRSVHDLRDLKPGTILVTEFVDPSWTISFIHLKGLITETGGVLSHGAVVAREYGLPAILAVPGALTRLRNGARVRMDGASGVISVLPSGPAR